MRVYLFVYKIHIVHVEPSRPLVEFQKIMNHECPILVEIEHLHRIMWPILHLAITKLGNVFVSPQGNAQHRYQYQVYIG